MSERLDEWAKQNRSVINQQQQPELPPHDYDNARYESVKIERNSKGVNIAIRTVRSDRETQQEWLDRTIGLYNSIEERTR